MNETWIADALGYQLAVIAHVTKYFGLWFVIFVIAL